MEHRFEVLCKDRSGRGIRRDRVVQESLITVDGKAFCSSMKPKLLHMPCSHLIAVCAESALQPGLFVSPYLIDAASPLQHDGDGLLDLLDEGTCRIPNDPV